MDYRYGSHTVFNIEYHFISDIIKTLGIGRTTFYRHFPPEEIQKIRPEK